MIEINLAVCGDHWLNPQVLRDHFPTDNKETLILRMSGEGPSLWATGIVQETLELCARYGRVPGTVWVGDWSNRVEEIPFARFTNHAVSHFFWMSETYRHCAIARGGQRRWFGYFLGRASVHRARMLQDLVRDYQQHVLVSVMINSGLAQPTLMLGDRSQWVQNQSIEDFHAWCANCDISSLDGHAVRDQYDATQNTNRDILAYYDQFRIEVVPETFTLGDCFFPTEKTIRPLSQGRGLLVHGPVNFLKRLRDLGFRTWNSIWDETYDSVHGPLRWQLMQTEMFKIVKMDPVTVDRELQNIHQHNSVVLDQIISTFRPK